MRTVYQLIKDKVFRIIFLAYVYTQYMLQLKVMMFPMKKVRKLTEWKKKLPEH